jgi:uncharacterized protein YjbJ (UPF0337 family)
MKLRSILFSIALGAFAAGCGGNDGEKFASLADEVCACEDLDCVDKVQEKWKKLDGEMRDKYKGKDEKPDESVVKAYEKAKDKARTCAEKIESAGDEGGGDEG